MCTTCESEPEPNHHGAAGTRALKAPHARPPRRMWPTLDWPGGGTPDLRTAPQPACRRGAECPGRCFAIVYRAGGRGLRHALRRGVRRGGSHPSTGPDVRPPGPVAPQCAGALRRERGRCLPMARAPAGPARRGTGRRGARAGWRSRGGASHWLTTPPTGTQTAIKHSATGTAVAPRTVTRRGRGAPAVAHFRVADRPGARAERLDEASSERFSRWMERTGECHRNMRNV